MSELNPQSRIFVRALESAYPEPDDAQLKRMKRAALLTLAAPVAVTAMGAKLGLGAKIASALA